MTEPTVHGDVLFILDPLSTINPTKDSSYLMIAEAERRGYQPWSAQLEGLCLRGADAYAAAEPLSVPRSASPSSSAVRPRSATSRASASC
jgi:glutathione synthase